MSSIGEADQIAVPGACSASCRSKPALASLAERVEERRTFDLAQGPQAERRSNYIGVAVPKVTDVTEYNHRTGYIFVPLCACFH